GGEPQARFDAAGAGNGAPGHGHRSEAARRGNPGKVAAGPDARQTPPRQPPTLQRNWLLTFGDLVLGRLRLWLTPTVMLRRRPIALSWTRCSVSGDGLIHTRWRDRLVFAGAATRSGIACCVIRGSQPRRC